MIIKGLYKNNGRENFSLCRHRISGVNQIVFYSFCGFAAYVFHPIGNKISVFSVISARQFAQIMMSLQSSPNINFRFFCNIPHRLSLPLVFKTFVMASNS